jgi:hypothetical protein
MRRFMVLGMLAVGLSAAGCQAGQTSMETYRFACTERPYDAGFCDRPGNWRLFGPRTGPFIGFE